MGIYKRVLMLIPLFFASLGEAAPPSCAVQPVCTGNTRCIVEAIPVSVNGLVGAADIDITLVNVSNTDQEVIVDVFATGAFGISNAFAAGVLSFPPTLIFSPSDCPPGKMVLGVCVGGYSHGCTGNTVPNVYQLKKYQSLHNNFHLEVNNGLNPDIHSSVTVMVRVAGNAGSIRASMVYSYAAPFIGVGTVGGVQQVSHFILNGGKPF